MKPSLFFLLFLFVVVNAFAQLPNKTIEEITKQDFYGTGTTISPGFNRETVIASTYMGGSIYTASSPNAHIYKINPANLTATDYGPAGYTEAYDSKYVWSLTNNGQYILGGTSHTTQLFYLNPSIPNSLSSLGWQKFKTDKITQLNDATYLYNYNGVQYVFFGSLLGDDSNGKVVVWNFSQTLAGNSNSISYLTLPNPGRTDDIEIGTYNGATALYVNQRQEGTDKIIIIRLTDLNYPASWITIDLLPLGLTGKDFVVIGGNIYLFKKGAGNTGYMNKMVAETQTLNAQTVTLSAWNNPNDNKYYFAKYGNKIITHSYVIDVTSWPPATTAYTGILDSRNICIDASAANAYGSYSWAGNPIHLYKVNLSSPYTVTNSSVNDNFARVGVTGGTYVTALAAGNNDIYASLDWSGIELKALNSSPAWSIQNIGTGMVQADKIVIDGPNRLYGLYSQPILRVVAPIFGGIDWLIDIKPYIYSSDRPSQVRINEILPIGNNQYLIATGGSVGSLISTKANILKVSILGEGIVITPIVRVKATSVTDLEYRNGRLYGVSDTGPFIYDIPATLVPDYEVPTKIPVENRETDCMVRVGDTLITADCHNLWVYNLNLLTNTEQFYNTSCGVHYYSYVRQYCGIDEAHPELWFDKETVIKQLMQGNDGLIYGFYDGTLFYFNYKDMGIPDTLATTKIKQLYMPGYPDYHKQGLEISNITKDALVPTNNTIYLSDRVGRLFRTINVAKQEASPAGMKTGKYSLDLKQNYPNPFNPLTSISFSIPYEARVSLKVFDVLGNQVSVLIDEVLGAGEYSKQFKGKNLSSGVYIYQLQMDQKIINKKFLLLK